MQLLVSVMSEEEVAPAVAGGADVIDVTVNRPWCFRYSLASAVTFGWPRESSDSVSESRTTWNSPVNHLSVHLMEW